MDSLDRRPRPAGPPPGHANRRQPAADAERGSTTLEAAILAPVLLLVGALLLFAGRTALAHQAVQHAAWEAARTASLARNPDDAARIATDQTSALLARLGCQPAVAVDTAGFAVPITQPASVTVAVACTVDLHDLALPGLPGTITLHATADSPLDRYRGRP